jgi:hypothetical protein
MYSNFIRDKAFVDYSLLVQNQTESNLPQRDLRQIANELQAPLSILRCRSRYEADLVVAVVSFVLTSMGLNAINKITFSRIV